MISNIPGWSDLDLTDLPLNNTSYLYPEFNDNNSGYKADISFDDSTKAHERCMIVCMDAGRCV